MDLEHMADLLNVQQVDAGLLLCMPTQSSQYTINDALRHLSQALPTIKCTYSKDEDAIVIATVGIEEPITISPAEDICSFGFKIAATRVLTEIEELVAHEDFSGAFAKVNQVVVGARNYTSRAPQIASQILNKLLDFCKNIPLEDIARGMGADSYSLTAGLPPTITFNFQVKEEKGS